MKKNVLTTQCKHNFHNNCLAQWMQKGTNTCPLCRSKGISNVLLRNMDVAKRKFLLKVNAFDKEFAKIDYKFIRMHFSMNFFPTKLRHQIAGNQYTITILWALLFDVNGKLKHIKAPFVELLKAYTKLENKLVFGMPDFNVQTKQRLYLHKKNIDFFISTYPFNMLSDMSIRHDYTFMRDIVKALELHKHDVNMFNNYMKFLTYGRKMNRQSQLEGGYIFNPSSTGWFIPHESSTIYIKNAY